MRITFPLSFPRVSSFFNFTNAKIIFNEVLIGVLGFLLVTNFLYAPSFIKTLLIIFSYIALTPVVYSAAKALWNRQITIDLLASIALVFTFIQGEWVSAIFINLMLASARLFSSFTERRTEDILSHLLKLRPGTVTVQVNGSVQDIPLEQVKIGNMVVVEAGNRVPVDGT
ncbi:MAG: hypothetical protein WCO12_03995, partial [bacterium]